MDQSKFLSKPSVSDSSQTNEATARAGAFAAAAGGGSEAASDSLKNGATVEILGLKSKPELNGSKAKLLKFDVSSGRWTVQVTSSGSLCSLKPENLKISAPPDSVGVVSGRTTHGGFSEQTVEIANQHLEQFIRTESITRLAELAFDPKVAAEKGLWGRARFSAGSPDVEKEVFLGQLEEMVETGKRMTSTFFCDVSFVREGLNRIYDGARRMCEILPRKSMCPLDIPLLQKVLIVVKMLEFMQSSSHWLPARSSIFRAMFGNAAFSERCGLLAFPSLARLPGPRNDRGTIIQERASVCERMSSSRAKDFMKQLWDTGTRLNDPVAVSFLSRALHEFPLTEANDAIICFHALEYASSIAQRDPTEYRIPILITYF